MYTTANFEKVLSEVTDHWSPRVVGQINDQYVKVAKLLGELAWHKHDEEDEMFYIVKGNLKIEYENGSVDLKTGDFHIVPRNTLHNPVAEKECWIALIEPVATKHTGDVETKLTKPIEDQLR
jgi:mannose-6-phosphate isomerase-like protein (cupin superfamily)